MIPISWAVFAMTALVKEELVRMWTGSFLCYNRSMKRKSLGIIFFFLCPFFAHAQIAITEIMYDVPGTDTGHEWIEIQNTSAADIDFSSWRLFEDGTNHKVTVGRGSGVLSPGAHAIIADKSDTFLSEWPAFQGAVFDSSFSLKNEGGETLAIRNPDLADVYSVSYESSIGAAGDGNSLQLVSGMWRAALPSPGKENVFSSISPPAPPAPSTTPPANPNTSTGNGNNTSNNNGNSVSVDITKRIQAHIISERVIVAGGVADFKGSASGFKSEPLSGARYMWNFGDGATREGEHILHTYSFPGVYTVMLSVAYEEYSATDRTSVEATAAQVRLSSLSQDTATAIVVLNDGPVDLDVSLWELHVRSDVFRIPAHSFVRAHERGTFSSEVTLLYPATGDTIILRFPNGKEAARTVFGLVESSASASVKRGEKDEKMGSVVVKKVALVENKKAVQQTNTQDIKNVVAHAADIGTSRISQEAAVGTVEEENSSGLFRWVLILCVLIVFASVATIAVRRKERSEEIMIVE